MNVTIIILSPLPKTKDFASEQREVCFQTFFKNLNDVSFLEGEFVSGSRIIVEDGLAEGQAGLGGTEVEGVGGGKRYNMQCKADTNKGLHVCVCVCVCVYREVNLTHPPPGRGFMNSALE